MKVVRVEEEEEEGERGLNVPSISLAPYEEEEEEEVLEEE